MPDEVDGTKELRLGLVCYGGSSLAIYMHGVTKEIHRAVKGSALLEAGLDAGAGARSETVYRDLLRTLGSEQGVRTRIVVDVIAGTSAGGINGIFLAKALAGNLSQDSLRDLWFSRGDMSQLLRLPTSWPMRLRLLMLLPSAIHRSPLRGGAMSVWLFKALEGMDAGGSEPAGLTTLLAEDGQLDLFVTITDFYGYDRQVPISDPTLVHDQRHRHALNFSYGPGTGNQFRREDNGGLAFAARTTSCFPGVFPPVSFAAFREWVPDADLRDLKDRAFRTYSLAGADPEQTQFIDGGVLDNKPFGWAIDAIKQRRADVEVDRRVLYLEPDPGERFLAGPGRAAPPKPAPTTLKALMAAVSGLPRHEPILDDLLEVGTHNQHVRKLQDVIETSFPGVSEFVGGIVGSPDDLHDDPNSPLLGDWSAKINAQTMTEAGLGYSTYLRAKISGVVERYAQTICDVCDFAADSNHAQLVRSVVHYRSRERGLFTQAAQPTAEQQSFLRDFDLGYGERRLRFVIAALRWWYRDLQEGKPDIPPRSDLDRGKTILYDALAKLRGTMGGEDFDDALKEKVKACFPDQEMRDFLLTTGLDPATYLSKHGQELDGILEAFRTFAGQRLDGFSAGLYRDMNDLSKSWHPDRRRDLLVRYLGFPLWDVLLYPIQTLADAGEKDEVQIQRLSPYEARVLSTPPEAKVQGKKLMHFWAFFDRKARENDYLWGRLDGAAHLLGILIGKEHPDYRPACLQAFAAILDEEEKALSHIPETVRELRAEIAREPAAAAQATTPEAAAPATPGAG